MLIKIIQLHNKRKCSYLIFVSKIILQCSLGFVCNSYITFALRTLVPLSAVYSDWLILMAFGISLWLSVKWLENAALIFLKEKVGKIYQGIFLLSRYEPLTFALTSRLFYGKEFVKNYILRLRVFHKVPNKQRNIW